MIKTKKPHEISAIKKPSDFLIFAKSMFRTFEKQGFVLKEKGYYTSVRWSQRYNGFILDNGTNKNRDISGINLDNLDRHYEINSSTFNTYKKILTNIDNKNSRQVFDKYKLSKNHTKCILLYITESECYVKGIFQFCQTKKREGCLCINDSKLKIISIMQEVKEEIALAINAQIEKNIKIKSYTNTYLDFVDFIKNKKFTVLSENAPLDLENILHKNKTFIKTDKNKSYSDYVRFINESKNKNIHHYEIFYFEKALLEFIQNLGYENIVYFDKDINNFLSLPAYDLHKLETFEDEDEKNNYSLNLFPKVI